MPLPLFNHPSRPVTDWEIRAFVDCYRALGQCVVDDTTGLLRPDWADCLGFATGWAWYDITAKLLVNGVVERVGPEPQHMAVVNGKLRRERLTESGEALVWMARIANDRLSE